MPHLCHTIKHLLLSTSSTSRSIVCFLVCIGILYTRPRWLLSMMQLLPELFEFFVPNAAAPVSIDLGEGCLDELLPFCIPLPARTQQDNALTVQTINKL